MNTLCKWILVAGAAAVMVGCNNSQPSGYKPEPVKLVTQANVKAGEEARYMPMVRGNQWVYEVTITTNIGGQSETRNEELTFRCTNVYRQGNKTFATLEAVMRGQVNERQQWMLEEGKGFYQVAIGFPSKPFTPPQPALRFPVQEGNESRWEGTGFVPEGKITKASMTSTVLGPQEVDTGAGRMEAIAVESRTEWSTGRAVQSTWWAPDVGIARYRQEMQAFVRNNKGENVPVLAISVMRLKSMSIKQSE